MQPLGWEWRLVMMASNTLSACGGAPVYIIQNLALRALPLASSKTLGRRRGKLGNKQPQSRK